MTTLETDIQRNKDAFVLLVNGRHRDPFALLGVHHVGSVRIVRTLQPQAERVELIAADGTHLADMERALNSTLNSY